MEDKKIKKNIKEATKLFKQTLEELFLKENKPFYGVSFKSYTGMLKGKVTINRKKDGDLRITGCIDKQHFKDDIGFMPRNIDDWKIYPLVVNLFK